MASKGASFLIAFWIHVWYIWPRNPLKRHFKIELENKSCNNVFVLLSCSFWHPFGHLMGRLFSPLGRECPQKGRVFSSLGPWTRKRWCLTLSGTTGASDISCFPESGAWGHTENDHLTCLPLALRDSTSERRPIKFDIKLGSAT